MSVPDARKRNKISLNPARVLSTTIPSSLLPQIFLSNALFVCALHVGKEWVFHYEVDPSWLAIRVLACGGLAVVVWEALTSQLVKKTSIRWPILGISSVLLLVQQLCLFMALHGLSCIRVVLFTHFSSILGQFILRPASAPKALAMLAALILSVTSDFRSNPESSWGVILGYGALTLHALSSVALEHRQGILIPSLGTRFTIAASTAGASLIALPLHVFKTVILDVPASPVLPVLSFIAIPLLAYSLLFLSPNTSRSFTHVSFTSQYFVLSYPVTFVLACFAGAVIFTRFPTWTDFILFGLLYYGMYPQTPGLIISTTSTSLRIQSYLKTILSNQESRKIFYFLLLNMCYMLVQMLYGVWTNSLGLISDAIHMAFDCMAIGVGLFASVMATWEPNERFTYGYGRIETLSGFANGIFLILISIFIVFEAIQRLLEPPEMNINQLLLVSTIGLAVNLFGMFATGGHHHHGGHSHSHDPSHSHNDSHSHSNHASHSHLGHASHSYTSQASSSHHASRSHSHSPKEEHLPVPSAHSVPYSQRHLHGTSHSSLSHPSSVHHDHSPTEDDHSHSHDNSEYSSEKSLTGHDRIAKSKTPNHKRHFHKPSLQIDSSQHLQPDALPASSLMVSPSGVYSPLTPNYQFGHDDHLHSHHKDHNVTHAHEHEGHSHNMRGVFLHVMADTLGSVGVIISTLLIQFYGWTGFDPIASLFIAILIAASVVPLVIDTGKILCLDVAGRDTTILQALSELSSVPGVASYSSPRFWPKDANSLVGSIHVQVDCTAPSLHGAGGQLNSLERIVDRVDKLLRGRISGLEELTIQVDEHNN